MNYNQSEVSLTISLRGEQAIRGCYSHYHRIEKDGKETNGVIIEKTPVYCKSYKTVRLGKEFIAGALEEAPKYLNMKPHIWNRLPEKRRIDIHIGAYVRALHPEHLGYVAEIF